MLVRSMLWVPLVSSLPWSRLGPWSLKCHHLCSADVIVFVMAVNYETRNSLKIVCNVSYTTYCLSPWSRSSITTSDHQGTCDLSTSHHCHPEDCGCHFGKLWCGDCRTARTASLHPSLLPRLWARLFQSWNPLSWPSVFPSWYACLAACRKVPI